MLRDNFTSIYVLYNVLDRLCKSFKASIHSKVYINCNRLQYPLSHAMHSMIKLLNLRLLSNGGKTNYRIPSAFNKYVTQPVHHLSTTAVTQVNRNSDIPPMLNDYEEPNNDVDTESYLKVMDLAEPAKKSKIKTLKPLKKYNKYMAEKELSAFPLSVSRKICRKAPNTLRVATDHMGAEILAHLSNHRNRDVELFEINPGPGFLSNRLLAAGEGKLKLIDESPQFNDTFETICKKYPGKCEYQKFNYRSLTALVHDCVDSRPYTNILDGIAKRNWEDDIAYQLFACSGTINFVFQLVYAITYQHSWALCGRGEYFLVLPTEILIKLLGHKGENKPLSTICEIYFEHVFMAELERRAFIPWWTRQTHETNMVLVKLVPRRNLLSLCKAEDLPGLVFFVKKILARKKTIIQAIDDWFPGGGTQIVLGGAPCETEKLEIIAAESEYLRQCTTMSNRNSYDINNFTSPSSLNASQILSLFNQVRNLKGYKNSKFAESIPGPYRDIEISPRRQLKR